MIALQEVLRKKLQFGLICLIVALIVYLLVMISALGSGLLSTMSGAIDSLDAQAIVFSGDSNDSFLRSELTASQRDSIQTISEDDSIGQLGYLAATTTSGSEVEDLALFGFAPGTISEPSVGRGRAATAAGEILIDSSLARESDIEVGDRISITNALLDYTFDVVGQVDEGQFLGQPTAFVTIDQWREIRYPGRGEDAPAASVILLQTNDSDLADAIEQQIQNTSVLSKSAAISAIGGVTSQQQVILTIQLFGFVIGILVVGSFFFVLTIQRAGEIAIFKAIGASSWWIFGQLVRQVLFIDLIAIAIGVPAALATDAALPATIPVEITATAFIVGGAGITIAAVVGSLFSARQVLRVDPMSALGQA